MHTGNTNYTDEAKRHLKKIPEPQEYNDDDSSSIMCRCSTCGRTFTDRPGFVGSHYSERVMLVILICAARRMPPVDAARTANEECGTKVREVYQAMDI